MIYQKYIKRVLDFILSLIALIVLCWLLVLISIILLLSDGTPVLFTQERVGQNGKPFKIYKFRTMVKNAESIGPKSTSAGDSRITPIGRFLRKTSLDELPQLFNLVNGTMSIVGYRPGVPENYQPEDYSSGMFNVKPGITGYAQVKGRSSLTLEEKRKWELAYVRDISFITDVKIIIDTFLVIIRHSGTN